MVAVVIGPGGESLADELASYGADSVHVFDDPGFAPYATESYARALAQAVAEAKASVVLVPFTAAGKDLAPRLAAKLGAGLASDCVALSVKDGRLACPSADVRRQGVRDRRVGGRAAASPRCGRTCSRWDRPTPRARRRS